VSPDPCDRDFMTWIFQHGIHRELVKREIMKRLGIGLIVTTQSHMESNVINKGMRLLRGWRLRLFGKMIIAVKF
jgi:hypothetical protein